MQDMEATCGREGQLGENLGAGLCRTEDIFLDPDDQQVFLADRCKAVNWPFLGGWRWCFTPAFPLPGDWLNYIDIREPWGLATLCSVGRLGGCCA